MTDKDAKRLMALLGDYDIEIELVDAAPYGGIGRVHEIYEDEDGSICYEYTSDLHFVGATESSNGEGNVLTNLDLDLVHVSKRLSVDEWRQAADSMG